DPVVHPRARRFAECGSMGLDRTSSRMNTLLLGLDLFGTFVFAISGAMAGVGGRFDIFGVLVLSFAVATFGGITRDVLIGAVPPSALTDWRYLAISLVAGVITFYSHVNIER